MTQISLFNEIPPNIEPEIDTTARDKAMTQVQDASPIIVLCSLREAVRKVAESKPNFNTDDVLEASPLTPPEPRVLGPVMQWARKQGLCRPVGARITGHRVSHNRPKMRWKSNIYGRQP